MERNKQEKVLFALSTGRYRIVDGRLQIFYRGKWSEKTPSNVNGYRQHILFGGRGWGKIMAYEHTIVWLAEKGMYEGEIDHLNGIRDDNRIENLDVVTKRENMLRCHKMPNHILKWDTFDRSSVMVAVELYLRGFGFSGIARHINKDRSSVVYQVNNILFGNKKSRYLNPDEVELYRQMYRGEIGYRNIVNVLL